MFTHGRRPGTAANRANAKAGGLVKSCSIPEVSPSRLSTVAELATVLPADSETEPVSRVGASTDISSPTAAEMDSRTEQFDGETTGPAEDETTWPAEMDTAPGLKREYNTRSRGSVPSFSKRLYREKSPY